MIEFEDHPDWTWQYGFETEQIENRKVHRETFHTGRTGFAFIDDHFGFRPGCLHTLLGGSGQGKSTLTQSLVLELTKTQPVLLYATEEDNDAIETKLSIMEPNPKYLSTKLHVTREDDFVRLNANINNPNHFLSLLSTKLKSSNAKILIIDNITTSKFYEFRTAVAVIEGLRTLAKLLKIPVLVLSHPKKGVNESKGLFTPDDCRGSNMLGMRSDYFYGLHRHQSTLSSGLIKVGAFVFVNKAREHDNQGFIYRLNYDSARKRYTGALQITFDVYKEVMKNRDKT